MCFLHVIHICVLNIVNNFTDGNVAEIAEAWIDVFTNEANHQSYVVAVHNNPVKMGHMVIYMIHASGLHHNGFLDTIKTGNLKNWFRDLTEKL